MQLLRAIVFYTELAQSPQIEGMYVNAIIDTKLITPPTLPTCAITSSIAAIAIVCRPCPLVPRAGGDPATLSCGKLALLAKGKSEALKDT